MIFRAVLRSVKTELHDQNFISDFDNLTGNWTLSKSVETYWISQFDVVTEKIFLLLLRPGETPIGKG